MRGPGTSKVPRHPRNPEPSSRPLEGEIPTNPAGITVQPGWAAPPAESRPASPATEPAPPAAAPPRPPRPRRPPGSPRPAPPPLTRAEKQRKWLLDLLAVLVVIGGVVAMVGAATYVAGHVVGNSARKQAEQMLTPTSCTLLSDKKVTRLMGRPMKALQVNRGVGMGIGVGAMDTRLLGDVDSSCWAVSDGDEAGPSARIARFRGGDAADVFTTARTTAATGSFLGAGVGGLGDEAFCTTPDASGASGVLARDGDAVVYVSLTEGTDACATAGRIARAVLDD